MADRVARSLAGLCSRDAKLCYYCIDALSMILLLACLASFCSFSPSFSRYVSLLRVASSVQQSSAPLQQVRVLVVSLVFCLIPEFLLFYQGICFLK